MAACHRASDALGAPTAAGLEGEVAAVKGSCIRGFRGVQVDWNMAVGTELMVVYDKGLVVLN